MAHVHIPPDFFNRFAHLGPLCLGIGLSRRLWQTTSRHDRTVTHLFTVGIVDLQHGRLLKITILWLTLGVAVRVRNHDADLVNNK